MVGRLYQEPAGPELVLGYAAALKAIGSRDQALEILTAGYRANQNDGEIAAELGRLALDMNRLDIAQQTLKVAETQGVKDWKTLSAQGTLRAKQGDTPRPSNIFSRRWSAARRRSVINNLALSYALDGKAYKSEELLRKAVASGHDDKRVRQNLALVLGLQGKFDEARQVASLDMSEQEAKSNMTYLRNMLANPTQFAAASPVAPTPVRAMIGSPSTPPIQRRGAEQERRRAGSRPAKSASGEGGRRDRSAVCGRKRRKPPRLPSPARWPERRRWSRRPTRRPLRAASPACSEPTPTEFRNPQVGDRKSKGTRSF